MNLESEADNKAMAEKRQRTVTITVNQDEHEVAKTRSRTTKSSLLIFQTAGLHPTNI